MDFVGDIFQIIINASGFTLYIKHLVIEIIKSRAYLKSNVVRALLV